MTRDERDAAGHDPVADLAGLKPAVERLRGLLEAAAAAEEAAGYADRSVTGEPDGLETGGPLAAPAAGVEPAPNSPGG